MNEEILKNMEKVLISQKRNLENSLTIFDELKKLFPNDNKISEINSHIISLTRNKSLNADGVNEILTKLNDIK